MRLTEIYSIVAVSLTLLASAAAIPVLAYQPQPISPIQRLEQERYNLTHSSHNQHDYQDRFVETNDVIRNLQWVIQN